MKRKKIALKDFIPRRHDGWKQLFCSDDDDDDGDDAVPQEHG